MVDEMTMYERCVAGMDEGFEENMVAVRWLCPWMDEEDVGQYRQVLAMWFELVIGEGVVDLEEIAGVLGVLAQRSEAMGDERRAWAFREWCTGICALACGEEYQAAEMPEELAAWPGMAEYQRFLAHQVQ